MCCHGQQRIASSFVATGNSAISLHCHHALMEKRGDPLIGRRLREARAGGELSQEELAARTGIGRSTIAGIEAATRAPGRRTLQDLAKFFLVPMDYFTNRDDLMASALWVLGRLPRDELEAWVGLLMARATRDKLPPRD